MVRKRIFAFGFSLRISRAASRPLRLGMPMSRATTSGFSARVLCTESHPSTASPHTSQPAWDSTRERRPWRTISWSSAIRMRRFDNCVPPQAGPPTSQKTTLLETDEVVHVLHGARSLLLALDGTESTYRERCTLST